MSSILEFDVPVNEAEIPTLPPGQYEGEVVAVTTVTENGDPLTSKNGDLMIKVEFLVPESQYPHDFKGDVGGMRLRTWVILDTSQKRAAILREFIEGLGLSAPKSRQINIDEMASEWVGRKALLDIARKPFNGRPNNEIVGSPKRLG
jgi:hypothetical protein